MPIQEQFIARLGLTSEQDKRQGNPKLKLHLPSQQVTGLHITLKDTAASSTPDANASRTRAPQIPCISNPSNPSNVALETSTSTGLRLDGRIDSLQSIPPPPPKRRTWKHKPPRWLRSTFWIRNNIDWNHLKPVLRSAVSAWICLLLLLIPTTLRMIGQVCKKTLGRILFISFSVSPIYFWFCAVLGWLHYSYRCVPLSIHSRRVRRELMSTASCNAGKPSRIPYASCRSVCGCFRTRDPRRRHGFNHVCVSRRSPLLLLKFYRDSFGDVLLSLDLYRWSCLGIKVAHFARRNVKYDAEIPIVLTGRYMETGVRIVNFRWR